MKSTSEEEIQNTTKERKRIIMKKLNENETRNLNGGYYYCKVCGLRSNSQWTVLKHVATRHIGAWTSNMYNLVMKVF